MTPFAREIVGDLLKPVAARNPEDFVGLSKMIRGAHCFDVAAAQCFIEPLGSRIEEEDVSVGMFGFLPAPTTWIEFVEFNSTSRGERFDILLIQNSEADHARVFFAGHSSKKRWNTQELALLRLASRDAGVPRGCHTDRENLHGTLLHPFIYAALAIINSPKVVNRRQHQPDGHLERMLLGRRRPLGRFPLHAWTEILLSVNTRDDADEGVREAHLTGAKALHFCRSFVRVRLGQLEIVRSHWRGDASIGIKRSRYIVEARP